MATRRGNINNSKSPHIHGHESGVCISDSPDNLGLATTGSVPVFQMQGKAMSSYIVLCAKPAARNPIRQTAIANDCASVVYMGRGEAARAASGNEDVIFIGRRLMSGTDRRADTPLEEEVTLSCGKYRYITLVLEDDGVWLVQAMLEGHVIHYYPGGHGYVRT